MNKSHPILLLFCLFFFKTYSQCYFPKGNNSSSDIENYFFISAGLDPLPQEKFLQSEISSLEPHTAEGLNLLFKAGYASKVLTVPMEFYVFYENFEPIYYEEIGFGINFYTYLFDNKVQALFGGELGTANRNYPTSVVSSMPFQMIF